MPRRTADRCKETSTTTGTGTITLDGAVAQFQDFQTAFPVGAYVQYAIVGQTGSEWEVGLGTLVTATTLSRDTILASSTTGQGVVNFSAGTKDVFATWTADGANDASLGNQLATARGWSLP